MSDIIQLLPDSVANQIAAGEVIQRPASAVKELMENSIDAGCTKIQLIIKDAGRTLIQVIDNGCGMSDADARLSFERHATSKIKKAEELFSIRTKGFRGEALASIAAIAQVELKTRLHDRDLGTRVVIEGSEVILQEPVSTPVGTSIAIKNLFYNVPARRNFLKSEAVEMRHIVEEYIRVALAHPGVNFSLHHNNNEIFNLPSGTLRQRIVNTFGSRYNERLVPLDEDTDIVRVGGFVMKPEFSKKTRGEQFFFVNNRFIRSNYLHHAVSTGFEDLITKQSHPSYFIYLDVDPASIDVNIHPTKTEIKFRDERAIYAIINSAVKRGLGRFNIAPSIDFGQETSFNVDPLPKGAIVQAPQITVDPTFNPFNTPPKTGGGGGSGFGGGSGYKNLQPMQGENSWEKLYEIARNQGENQEKLFQKEKEEFPKDAISRPVTLQWQRKYIVTTIASGLLIIDQQKAHERVLFEKALHELATRKGSSQQLLFPETIQLSPADYELLHDLLPLLNDLGFQIGDFGSNTAIVHGVPENATETNTTAFLESILEGFKHFSSTLKADKQVKIARAMAMSLRIKPGKILHPEEMNNLIDELFACEVPYYSPGGKPTIVTFTLDELDKKFEI